MDIHFYNLLIAVSSVIYVFAAVAIMDFFVKKGFPQDISRKVIHIAAGCWLVFWLLYDDSHYSKYYNIAPAVIWMLLLIQKGLFAKEDDEAVKTMTRTGDRKELLRGPLFFTIVMSIFGTAFYKTPLALTSLGILSFGDGIAPLAGKYFGKHKYNFVTEKSYEGSLVFFIMGLLGASLFNSLFSYSPDYNMILICAGITTIVEALSPKDLDNFLIPVTCIIVYNFV